MDINLKRESYDYQLPPEQIAQYPATPRDSSRLLVFDSKTQTTTHTNFSNILNFLRPGDVLVLNNTRVLPARLMGSKVETGAKIEVLLQKRIDLSRWSVVAKPTKRLKVGTVVEFDQKLKCKILSIKEYGECEIEFEFDGVFEDVLREVGSMPLPHYIHKKLEDSERYQTVYSKQEGSSAAPTAGLHWTNQLLKSAKEMGVEVVNVLLHVGLGTFRPVKEDNILNHKMHSEYIEVTKEAADAVNRAKAEGRRVIAVGTTSVRTLESAATESGKIQPCKKNTEIFIYPGYEFKIVDGIVTNFHLPQSTLIMLVSAFLGREKTLELYNEAVRLNYRFFSFGDACLFL